MTYIFQKQKSMRKVVLGLFPAFIGSIYFFGWVSIIIVFLSVFTCVFTEWLFVRKYRGKVSEAVLVTGMLFGLILPPTIPLYMVILGAVFGITFGKMAFGGFGYNVFNPAMVARAFVYITFPVQMTNRWIPAANFSDFPGGFAALHFFSQETLISAITTATPTHAAQMGATHLPGFMKLFMGNINGQFTALDEMTLIGGGSLGETSALLIILGGFYLLIKKISNWRLVLSFFVVYFIFQTILHQFVPLKVVDPVYALFTGGAVLGGFFMVTDPVSGPKTHTAQVFYSAFIAILTVLIRSFSLFAGGLMFAILLGNMFAPLMDYCVRSVQNKERKI